MKKNILFHIFTLLAISIGPPVYAQFAPVSSLNENFDVKCVTSTTTLDYPTSHWLYYNPVLGTDPDGAWNCAPSDGNRNTPGVKCTGYYGSAYHLDTSYLITPLLNLSSYTGTVYLHFDSKTSLIYDGSKISILASPDSLFRDSVVGFDNILSPFIGEPDSSGWQTHEINLDYLKYVGNFYLSFRYTSTTTSGSIWYLDNINTSTKSVLNIPILSKSELPLTVTGIATGNEIDLAYSPPETGMYKLSVYDMVGREVYRVQLHAHKGTERYTITGLGLHTGMYCIKMNNANTYGITKVMVQ